MFDCPSTLTRSIEDRVDVFKFPEIGFAWNFVPYLRKYAIYIVMHDFQEAGDSEFQSEKLSEIFLTWCLLP